jgi:enterochelin esterase family protein
VDPGAYRYNFNVDNVSVIDPHNPSTSESNGNTWSLIYIPGSEISDAKQIPHGAVAKVTYYSGALKRFRRFHVYTPPGYEDGQGKYPILYLLHGALDCDESWSSVGRAGFILDNLIAAGRAKPMIVVMPAGHTGPFRFGPPGDGSFQRQMDEFGQDFTKDLKPYVEKNYRVLDDRSNRAIAGLSMGGAQTLNIAFENLDEFGYVGVFSSGIFGIAGGFGGAPPSTKWEDSHKAVLDDADMRRG